MKKSVGRKAVKAVILSGILMGTSSLYSSSVVLAADPDSTTIVKVGGGSYNSVTVDKDDRDGSGYVYGVYGANGNITVTMTGSKTIIVTDTADLEQGYKTALAHGVNNAEITAETTAASPLIISVTATSAKDKKPGAAAAEARGMDANSKVNNYVNITATATGGEAANNIAIPAVTNAQVKGMSNDSTAGNAVTIKAEATGGTSTVEKSGYANAEGETYGIAYNSAMGNNASITAKATGGNATGIASTNQEMPNATMAFATASACGVSDTSTVGDNAVLDVEATGGSAKGTSNAYNGVDLFAAADAYGVRNSSTVGKNAVITVTAKGGTTTVSGNLSKVMENARANAYGVFSNSTVGDNATITVTALGGTANKNATAYAYGAKTDYANNTNKFLGAVKIITKAEVTKSGAAFHAYALYAAATSGNVGVNDLATTGKQKIIEGDIYAEDNGQNNIIMDTAGSYLQGNITNRAYTATPGKNSITISNGAVWRPVYDNRYGTDCNDNDSQIDATNNRGTNKVAERTVSQLDSLTLNKDGIIDLTWDGWGDNGYDTTRDYRSADNNGFRKLTIENLAGADGILKVDSNLANNLADTLIIGSVSSATSLKIQVNYDDFYANSAKGDTVTGKALVVTDNSTNPVLTVSGTQSEYNEKTYTVTVEKDANDSTKWNITKIEDITVPKPDTEPTPTPVPTYITENTKHAADSRDNVNNIWDIETNSLVKRLGDLRSMNKDAAGYDNMWVKYGHGTQKLGQGRDTEIKYNQFQIGYDKALDGKKGKTYRGLMVSRINGDASYERGSGDTNSTTLGLYQTWFGDKGHYYDVILRYGKINTDYNVTDLSDNYSDADYSTWATTLSGEYGYRKTLGSGTYIEPSAELILGHIGSADYTTSKNMDVYLDATKHAITRVGFVAGKDFGEANTYFKANYYHDFAGGGSVTTGTVHYDNDQPKNWTELGIGGNIQLSKNASAYAEVRKLFGNLKSNVNFSLGARWKF